MQESTFNDKHGATRDSGKPRLFEARVASLYAAEFVINGFYLPFFPVWLALVGMDAAEISLILAAAMVARIVSAPFIMALTDRSSERVHILIVLSILSVMCAAMFLVARSFAGLLALSFVLGVVSGCQVPITDSVALSGVRRFGSDYARMRVWGSISFLAANLAGGLLLKHFGAGITPGILLCAFGVTGLVALALPRLGAPRKKSPLPGEMAGLAGRAFLRNGFVLFMTAAALVQASHAFVYGFSSIYWRSIGIDDFVIGFLWAVGVLAEIILFYMFKRHFGAIRPETVLVAGSVAAVVRWLLFPLIAPMGLGSGAFFAVQTLHGLSFGLTYLAMQQKTAESIGENEIGSAQGIFVFISGLTLSIALYLSGPLYAAAGVNGFWAMAAVACAGTVIAIAILMVERRRSD